MMRSLGFVLLLLLALTAPGWAQLPVTRLWTLFPPGGRAGSSPTVTFTGTDVEEASRIYFSHSNITARPSLVEATGYPEANKMVVTIASSVPPGIYEARVVGRFGISNARAFAVSDRPEMLEPSTNNTAAAAAEMALNSVVNGTVDANASDFYQFQLAAGQHVIIEAQAKSIDSRLEPVLTLSDAAGRELERNRKGGLLDFTAATPGSYIVQVHDAIYRGGSEFFYRLAVGTGPHLDFIFPPSGLPGTKARYTLYGRNLPGGIPAKVAMEGKPLEQLAVEIELPSDSISRQRLAISSLLRPADSFLDGLEYQLSSTNGVSNPVLISFATAPVIVEQDPNDKPETAQKITVPCEYVGQFYPDRDQDWVTFEAKKGEVYWLEVFSQRLGYPTDPFLLVQRVVPKEKGAEEVSDLQEAYDSEANIGEAVFNTATKDPSWRFEVKDDGTYRVLVRDLFGQTSSSPGHLYRLSLRREAPDFRLVAIAPAPPPVKKDSKELTVWTPFLRRGETLPVKVLAFRRDNYGGDIVLTVEGLPPGVGCSEARIEAGKTSALLMLTAAEDAPAWVGPLRIQGTARVGEAEIKREARGGSMLWNVADPATEAVEARMTRDLVLAVSGDETAPLSFDPDPAQVHEMSVAGKLQIPLKITRRGDFAAALKLKAIGIPAVDALKELDTDGKTNRVVLEIDLAQTKIPVGSHTLYLQTQTAGKYQTNPARVKAAEEESRQAQQVATDAQAAARKAEEARKAAESAAAQAAAESKKAEEALTAVAKLAADTAAALKAATEKAAASTPTGEKTELTAEAAAAKTAAAKVVEEATAKAKAAQEGKAAAEHRAQAAAAQAKASTAAQTAATQAEAQAQLKAKTAEARKTAAAERAKEITAKVQPKDATLFAYSAPIRLQITPAPVTLSSSVLAGQVDQGGKIRIPINLTRLYHYADPVELTLVSPKGVAGLNAAKIALAKDQTQADVLIEAAADATPGDHQVIIQAMLKFNNQPLQVDQRVALKVMPVAKK